MEKMRTATIATLNPPVGIDRLGPVSDRKGR